MFEAANIREWRGHDVVDAQGHKIGGLEAVYVDTAPACVVRHGQGRDAGPAPARVGAS
jgi:hypothetical protein